METIYYTLDARRLTLQGSSQGRRASGGGETICYAVAPRRPAARRDGGTVINLADYRQPQPSEETEAPEHSGEDTTQRPQARHRLSLAVDLLASCAVVILLAAVVLRFFSM